MADSDDGRRTEAEPRRPVTVRGTEAARSRGGRAASEGEVKVNYPFRRQVDQHLVDAQAYFQVRNASIM
jgi:hypothetical protein